MVKKKKTLGIFKKLIISGMFIFGIMLIWMVYFATKSIDLKQEITEIHIDRGNLTNVSQQLVDANVLREPYSFILMVRVLGQASAVKAGNYEFKNFSTPYQIAQLLTKGGLSTQTSITFIEGWTFKQMRAALNKHETLKHKTMALSDREILEKLGSDITHPEGLFFPDTYFLTAETSDEDVLKRSYETMKTKLDLAWQGRADNLPYKTPYEALIMASIVEKETGRAADRAMIAGVFVNRLKLGMRLQTDPTVIYGMGDRYNGNIRKNDLLRDTVYNTYTRDGLPPTPIALPGLGAIEAATHPATTKAIYFVGKGEGNQGVTVFSETLEAHNKAVVKYQLKK